MKKKSVKQDNRRLILDYLRTSSIVSVSDISSMVHVSNPTVKKVLDHYAEIGLVSAAGKGDSTLDGGKRPELYRLNRDHAFVIALHVGPDFIYATVMNVMMEMVHTSYQKLGAVKAEEVVELLADKVAEFLQLEWAEGKHLANIVIALPGIVNWETGESIYSPHYPQWGTNYPFVKEFRKLLCVEVPIYINGVNRLQAFAELVKGKAQGRKNFIIIDAMDEGVGAGLMVEGSMLHGFHNLSGEIGHMILDPLGPKCICGGRGCFEALVSVRNINRILRNGYSSHQESAIYQGKTPEDVTVSDLFKVAETRDAYAMEILEEIASYFALGINNVVMINDPELIVIQGIYIEAGEQFLESLKKRVMQLAYPYLKRDLELVFSGFREERGAVGAGSFGVCQYFESSELYF